MLCDTNRGHRTIFHLFLIRVDIQSDTTLRVMVRRQQKKGKIIHLFHALTLTTNVTVDADSDVVALPICQPFDRLASKRSVKEQANSE